jgi:hypothetical protein
VILSRCFINFHIHQKFHDKRVVTALKKKFPTKYFSTKSFYSTVATFCRYFIRIEQVFGKKYLYIVGFFYKRVSAFNFTHCMLKKNHYNINLSHAHIKKLEIGGDVQWINQQLHLYNRLQIIKHVGVGTYELWFMIYNLLYFNKCICWLIYWR